jgi:hypothetical protein
MQHKCWEQFHRRSAVIEELLLTAEDSGDFSSPWRNTPTVWEEYHDVADLLRDLYLRFETTLMGALALAHEESTGEDLRGDLVDAFRRTVRHHHGIRRVLEANAEHPALAHLLSGERLLVADLAGVGPESIALPNTDMISVSAQRRAHWWSVRSSRAYV